MRTLKWFSFLLMSALPMMAGSDASVTITYSPVSGTPALSETMLIALGLLLPVLAFRSLRSMKGGGTIAAILAAGTLMMLEAVTGFRMIPESKAILSGPVLSVAGGGTTTSFSLSNGNTYPVTNSSGVTQVIRSINWTFNSGGVQVTTGAGYCAVGTTLIQNATCNLRITLNLGL